MIASSIYEWRAYLYPLGLLSAFCFGLRFLVQWLKSEKAHRSVLPRIFWKLSLTGNISLAIHALIQSHFPISLFQALQGVLSWRNLNLESSAPVARKTLFIFFAIITCIVTSLFVMQDHLFGKTSWIAAPHSMGTQFIPPQIPLWMHVVGFIGLGCFSLRFWEQWWKAERKQKSEIDSTFWWLSLVGAIISSFYFLMLVDWINLMGSAISIVPYTRNLFLITKEKKAALHAHHRPSVFIFAGEMSADLYGSKLLPELKKSLPTVEFFGVGGPLMQKAGLQSIYPIQDFQVMGFSDVLRAFPRLLLRLSALKRTILTRKPMMCICIDQPSFTMRLAKRIRKAGYKGKIIQYVAPTVWAYKEKRAHTMAKYFDLLLTLFSFEPSHFAHTNLKTVWAGHPIVETITPTSRAKEKIIAIFPGSRPAEITRNLSLQLEAAIKVCEANPDYTIAISVSSPNFQHAIDTSIARISQKNSSIKISTFAFENRYEIMQKAALALAKSGTVTLELALHGVPTLVSYKLSALNRLMAKYVLKLKMPYYCIVNILKGQEVYPEFIENEPTVEKLTQSALTLLNSPRHEDLAHSLHQELQNQEMPTQRAATAILETLYAT